MKPVAVSAITIGEAVVERLDAQEGMAAFRAVMPVVEPMPRGITRSTLGGVNLG